MQQQLPEYDYTTGHAICRECGHADYLHELACTVVAPRPCPSCGHPMMEGPVQVQRRDTEAFDRATADWYCMNCHTRRLGCTMIRDIVFPSGRMARRCWW